jgi:hypothetical protein
MPCPVSSAVPSMSPDNEQEQQCLLAPAHHCRRGELHWRTSFLMQVMLRQHREDLDSSLRDVHRLQVPRPVAGYGNGIVRTGLTKFPCTIVWADWSIELLINKHLPLQSYAEASSEELADNVLSSDILRKWCFQYHFIFILSP